MSNVLAAKDVNTTMATTAAQDQSGKPDIKSMEYHRQVLQNKMDQAQYVIPTCAGPCYPPTNILDTEDRPTSHRRTTS